MPKNVALTTLLLLLGTVAAAQPLLDLKAGEGMSWFKGNTHTHTLWSDGDAAPEVAVAWYADHGYDFLCLSDHNVLIDAKAVKWQPIGPHGLLPESRVDEIRAAFGEDWVETAEQNGRAYMRLKTLPELKKRFEAKGGFLLIPAEEITSFFPSVHMNAINLREEIQPVNSEDPAESIAAAIDAMQARAAFQGQPYLLHLNHPNWGEGVTAEQMLAVPDLEFFEVYNGHSEVRNWGDAKRHLVSTGRLWDIMLSVRLLQGSAVKMYGMATDDTHAYYERRIGRDNAGRGWIQVLADTLETDALINAIHAGHFYATSGVTVDAIHFDGNTLSLQLPEESGVTYTTRFIGTRADTPVEGAPVLDDKGQPVKRATLQYSDRMGATFAEVQGNTPAHTLQGNELYIRAVVESSKLQDNPFMEGDHEKAWIQPITIPKN
ncbi:MAG: hypothetical protein HYV27_13065 [Candidatus Hydrogenedentes bacterium]|nr:hypothetical protein [Candidatus Hydrogenedentota bacterium]